jgi:hypothetical protein
MVKRSKVLTVRSQVTAFASAFQSYTQAIQTDPAILNLVSSLANDPADFSSFQVAMSSFENYITNGQILPATILLAFPSAARPVISSIINVENSIAAANGFTATFTLAQNTAQTNAAKPTGNAMLGTSAGVVAGFIGAVALL